MTNTYKKPKILPVAWLLLAIAAIVCLHLWWPVAELIPRPFNWFGVLFAVAALAMLRRSVSSFLQANTGLLPFSEATRLVTDGFYRFTRNPMYLGMTALLLALAMMLGSAGAFVPVVLFVWIIDRQFIRNEELFLLETFGDEYREYRRNVRRWI